jgi:hypothetical protein
MAGLGWFTGSSGAIKKAARKSGLLFLVTIQAKT